jgi:hypothetical protein
MLGAGGIGGPGVVEFYWLDPDAGGFGVPGGSGSGGAGDLEQRKARGTAWD